MKSRLWAVMTFGFFLGAGGVHLSAADTTPPQLVSLSFSPTTVDTSLSDQTITVTGRVTDDLAGIGTDGPSGYVAVDIWSPSKSQELVVFFWHAPGPGQSGSATNGTFTTSITVPRYSEPGVWTVDSAVVCDSVGNTRTLTGSDLLAAGLPIQFTVQGTGDVTPPQLASLSLSTTTVDTTTADQAVMVRMRVTDDLSGITNRGWVTISFVSPSHAQQASVYFSGSNRQSGSLTDGYYTNNLVLKRYSEPGIWTVDQATLYDGPHNRRTLFPSDFLAAGLPTQITVQGTGDTTPPQLVSVSLSTTNVDTTFANQFVTVRLHVTDDLVGITGFPQIVGYSLASVVYRSPSGKKSAEIQRFLSWNRESGSDTDGFYTSNLAFPRYCEPGVWTVDNVQVFDALGNQRTFGLSDFLAAGWPAQILVTEQPTLQLVRSGEAVLVSWPTNADGFVLQSKGALDSGVSWTNVPGAPVLLGQDRILSLPVREGAAFFRLLKPSP